MVLTRQIVWYVQVALGPMSSIVVPIFGANNMSENGKAGILYTYFCNGKSYHIFDGQDGVTQELILILEKMDHEEELQTRYSKENSDFKTEFLKEVWTADDRAIDPIDSIADFTYAPEDILFSKEEMKTRKDILDELVPFLTPDQEELYRYLCMGLKAKEIAEIFNTTEDAIKKRKRKLIARLQRHLD